jgi:ankyrin repeat protein
MRILSMLPERTRVSRRTAYLVFVITVLCAFTQGTAQSSQQQGVGLDARNTQGLTLLMVAASADQADTVRSLLAQGANINATSTDGRTALIAAAQNNHLDVVQILVTAGANLNAAARGTGTALEAAENKGETQIAALLLASGAHSSGKSVGDTVCVLPWGGDGFCGTVKSFSIRSVAIQITKIVGCTNGCSAKVECSAAQPVGGSNGVQAGSQIAVPSWCMSQTGVRP